MKRVRLRKLSWVESYRFNPFRLWPGLRMMGEGLKRWVSLTVFFFLITWRTILWQLCALCIYISGCAGSSLLHRLFSSCGEWGLLFGAVHRLLLWWCVGSVVWPPDLVAPRHVRSSPTKDWAIREAQSFSFLKIKIFFPSFPPSSFLSCHAACGLLVPRPGMESKPMAVNSPSSNHWTARKFPKTLFFRTILSWQHWGEVTEISYIAHPSSLTSLMGVVHLLSLMDLHWCITITQSP